MRHNECWVMTLSNQWVCPLCMLATSMTLYWRHNDHDGVSNHQPHGCLLNRLFRRISKKTSKLRVTGLCVGNSPGPVNSPHKGPLTRKMFLFDDVIMDTRYNPIMRKSSETSIGITRAATSAMNLIVKSLNILKLKRHIPVNTCLRSSNPVERI